MCGCIEDLHTCECSTRTAIRNLVRAGVPEIVATRLCGHKTRAIFDRYSIINEAMLREGVEKLAWLHENAERKVVPIDERGKQTLRHSGTVSDSEPVTAEAGGS